MEASLPRSGRLSAPALRYAKHSVNTVLSMVTVAMAARQQRRGPAPRTGAGGWCYFTFGRVSITQPVTRQEDCCHVLVLSHNNKEGGRGAP